MIQYIFYYFKNQKMRLVSYSKYTHCTRRVLFPPNLRFQFGIQFGIQFGTHRPVDILFGTNIPVWDQSAWATGAKLRPQKQAKWRILGRRFPFRPSRRPVHLTTLSGQWKLATKIWNNSFRPFEARNRNDRRLQMSNNFVLHQRSKKEGIFYSMIYTEHNSNAQGLRF